MWNLFEIVGFEVFTAVTMKNAVLWYVAPCGSCKSRRFGGTCRLHLQGRRKMLEREKMLDDELRQVKHK
jgi:hypothetical protein